MITHWATDKYKWVKQKTADSNELAEAFKNMKCNDNLTFSN